MTSPTSSTLLRRRDVCARLGVHLSTVRRLERLGKLPAYHLTSKCARYRQEDVDRLLTESRHNPRLKPGPKPRQSVPVGAA